MDATKLTKKHRAEKVASLMLPKKKRNRYIKERACADRINQWEKKKEGTYLPIVDT